MQINELRATTREYSAVTSQDNSSELSRQEKFLALGVLALVLLLRIVYGFHYRFNSDESQHLHVVWAWAHGLVQHRDIFDNHMPLFQMLCAPLVWVLGDRADLLLLMRLAMLPVWGVTLWGTYRLMSALSCPRHGWWAAILAALWPPFFLGSVEFRTDDLWAMFWVLSLAILVSGRVRPLRSFAAAVLLGAAFGVSMKSSVLLASLLFGGLMTVILCPAEWRRPGWAGFLAANLGAAIIGSLLVPVSLVVWFYAHGAIAQFYYGAIQHNMLSNMGRSHALWQPLLFIPALIAALVFARFQIIRNSPPGSQTTRRVLIFLTLTVYVSAIKTLWPLVTLQDFLPVWPLLAVSAVPLLDCPLPSQLPKVFSGRSALQVAPAPLFLLLAALCCAILLTAKMPLKSQTAKDLETWKAVLDLTDIGDYVMDAKGGLIFRQRAVYYVFEHITEERISRRLIDPQITRRLIETRTCVVDRAIKRYPQDAQQFIEANYLSIGPLLVAGKMLMPQAADPTTPVSFEVVIPEHYEIIMPSGPADGELDDKPYHGISFLGPGRHTFRPAQVGQQIALVWSRAVDKGYSPFNTRGKSQ